jgi:hypothetical protein
MEPKDGLRQILDPSSDFWQVTLGLLGLGLIVWAIIHRFF